MIFQFHSVYFSRFERMNTFFQEIFTQPFRATFLVISSCPRPFLLVPGNSTCECGIKANMGSVNMIMPCMNYLIKIQKNIFMSGKVDRKWGQIIRNAFFSGWYQFFRFHKQHIHIWKEQCNWKIILNLFQKV